MANNIAKEADNLSYEPENIEDLIDGKVEWDGKQELIELASKLYASRSIRKYAKGKGVVPLDKQEIWQVAIVAQKYGFDPLAKHVVWYQEQPYVTVSGLLYVAQNKPDFDSIQIQIVSGEERLQMIDAMGIDDEGTDIDVFISSNKTAKKKIKHCIVKASLFKKGSSTPTICYASASVGDVAGNGRDQGNG
jgi:hypothetical protein